MRAKIGLYYPYAHIRDTGWLKVAALYWPKLARIVPAGYPLEDNELSKTLTSELDFFVNLDPANSVDEAGEILAEAVRQNADALRGLYGLTSDVWQSMRNGSLKMHWPTSSADNYRPKLTDTQHDWINGAPSLLQTQQYAKAFGELVPVVEPADVGMLLATRLSRRHVRELQHQHLAFQVNDRWTVMSADIAWVYMCVLAERVAIQNGLTPVTNHEAGFRASYEWTSAKVSSALLGRTVPVRGATIDHGCAGLLALNLVTPKTPHALSAKSIVKLRQDHVAEFDAFHAAIASMVKSIQDEIPTTAEQPVIDAYVRHVVTDEFRSRLSDIDKALRSAGIETVLSSIAVKVEVPAAAAAGAAIAKNPMIGAAAGAVLAFVGIARQHSQRARLAVSPSAESYLWQIRRAGTRRTIDRLLRSPSR